MTLFDDKTETAIRESFDRASVNARTDSQALYDIGAQYVDGDMTDDVEDLLNQRYPNRQRSDARARIAPWTLPLVQYFLDELATLYNTSPKRCLVDENGEESETETALLNEALDEIGYDSTLQYVSRVSTLLRACGLYWQTDDQGLPDPIVIMPQDIWPIAPDTGYNKANPQSYLGYVLDNRLDIKSGAVGSVIKKTYTLVKPEGVLEYVAPIGMPHVIRETITEFKNPFRFQGEAARLFTLWFHAKPSRNLLAFPEPSIMNANRNLNVQFSVLQDVFRFQCGALPIKVETTGDTFSAAGVPVGVHFMQSMKPGEDMDYLTAGNDWSALTKFLVDYANLALMLARTGAGGELNLEGRQVASGFAKLIDELPKLEARDKQIPQAQRNERSNWPILAAMLIRAKRLPASAERLRLKVEFSKSASLIPQAPQERIAEAAFEFEHGISSPAEYLAQSRGISIEEAEERIAENTKGRKAPLDLGNFESLINGDAEDETEEEPEEKAEEEKAEEEKE